MHINRRLGFTLVELSVVLLIISLIAGAILVGRDMINAALLRSIISDAEELNLAVHTFEVKYNGLPGDMATAEEVWGSDVACPNTPTNTVLKQETCNGNGDGMIRHLTTWEQPWEPMRAAQQIANAALYRGGHYTGVSGSDSFAWNTLTGINIPKLKNFNAGMLMLHNDPAFSIDHLYPSQYRLMVHIGVDVPDSWNHNPFLLPADAQYIDLKADDGKPGKGFWMSYRKTGYASPDCTTSDDPEVAAYDYELAEIKCAIVYIIRRD